MQIIRSVDRFYEKHPNIAFGIAILCVFAVLEIAHQWDQDDTASLRLQMWAASSKGAT